MTKQRHDRQVSFRLTPDLEDALNTIKERDGVPLSEQIRRGVQLWIVDRNQYHAFATGADRKGKR